VSEIVYWDIKLVFICQLHRNHFSFLHRGLGMSLYEAVIGLLPFVVHQGSDVELLTSICVSIS